MRKQAQATLKLENDLRLAIERREFRVVYQPIVSLETNRVTGFEALVRWNRKGKGLVLPGEFLATAEETRLIVPIGWFVLRDACRQLREWREEFPAAASLKMNVNFSPTQINDVTFLDRFTEIVRETGAGAKNLALEITENVVFDYAAHAVDKLSQLASMGVCLCVDDFGTGHASLSSLRKFLFKVLKIDRSFIRDAREREECRRIVTAIINLAHSLYLKVIAEGVETAEQTDQLKALKCDYAQGYRFSEPIGHADVRKLLSGDGP